MSEDHRQTGAEALLTGLKRAGVEWLFANAGTDFPPVIEALAGGDPASMPIPVTIPHESAAVAMAHGVYLVTGRPQAVMVHVNVGLANAVMGVINAASDNVPMLVMSGRTPLTERARAGCRMSPIQYGQEMFDQTSLVRDMVKYNYELRYPEQGGMLVDRALSLARSEPCGPVYLSLPKEPLSDVLPHGSDPGYPPTPPTTPAMPDPGAVVQAAEWLGAAQRPVLLCQRGDVAGHLSGVVSELAQKHGIAVHEPFTIRNLLPASVPCLQGYGPGGTKDADLVIVLDSGVPWIEALETPAPDARVIHIGPDPHFNRMPVRSYRSDLAIAGDPVATIQALIGASKANSGAPDRLNRLRTAHAKAQATRQEKATQGATSPMSAEWISHCVGQIMDPDAVAFSELGLLPGFLNLQGPNRHFNNVHAGGLGWALPAALGAQLARPGKLTIACMGDGSYMFSNPVACHQIAEAVGLPVLTIVKNNGLWNAVRRSVIDGYPGGAAARANAVPLTGLTPLPDFTAVARASRGYAERIQDGADLPQALNRALAMIAEGRPALLELVTEVSDTH
ncbi:thiamine pyrophosphate-requiring protein [Primorskyibacter sp. 2E233]|uniref:thiamine pyrophosphate-requiring protein n=1 Tax=Primorskyibacter sp. 2E233 TaxID=3413431 RepID=UPI003BF01DCE